MSAETPQVPEPARGQELPDLLTMAEVAAIFRRQDRTIRRWISMGHLVPVRVGRALFFRADDVRRMVSTQMTEALLRGRETSDAPS